MNQEHCSINVNESERGYYKGFIVHLVLLKCLHSFYSTHFKLFTRAVLNRKLVGSIPLSCSSYLRKMSSFRPFLRAPHSLGRSPAATWASSSTCRCRIRRTTPPRRSSRASWRAEFWSKNFDLQMRHRIISLKGDLLIKKLSNFLSLPRLGVNQGSFGFRLLSLCIAGPWSTRLLCPPQNDNRH